MLVKVKSLAIALVLPLTAVVALSTGPAASAAPVSQKVTARSDRGQEWCGWHRDRDRRGDWRWDWRCEWNGNGHNHHR
jgi:hypothetical protein